MKMKTCGRLITAGYCLSVFLLSAGVQSSTAASPAVSASAGSSAAAAPAGGGSVDATSMIAAHNEWRAKVGVPGLKWSEKLAGIAQQWTDHLAATTCSGGHSGNEYGENIFMASARMYSDGRHELSPKSPKDAVDAWGSEVQWYDYSTNSCHMECGHYTQVVWKDTKEVGCAMSVCADKTQIWVCNYYPAGNMVGKKPY